MDEIQILQKKLERERKARRTLEDMIENRTRELFIAKQNVEEEKNISIKSEERLKAILNSMQIGIAIIDSETHKIVDVNPCAAKMIGTQKEKIIGNVCHKFICPAEVGQCPITDLGMEIDNSEQVLLKANGESLLVLKTVIPVTLNGQEHIIDSFVDITEQKKVEKALKKRIKEQNSLYSLGELTDKIENLEELFNQFLKNVVPVSMQFPDKTFGMIELDGKKYFSKDSEQCNNCITAPIKILKKQRGILKIGYTEDLPFVDIFEPRLINSYAERLGKIIERIESNKLLKESEERFRLLFENASDGILIADVETKKFISANIKICKLTGYSLNELLNLSVGDILPKEDLPEVIEKFEKQVKGEIELAQDIPILKKDGTIIYADVNSKTIILNGKTCLVGIFRDITEIKRLKEKEIKRSNLEAINNMVVTINHEMNQPLSVICSFAGYLMKDVEKDSQAYEDAEIIHEEAWKLAELVKKTSKLKELKTTDYSPGTKMIDLGGIDNEK